MNFLIYLANSLNISLEQSDITNLFYKLQKSGNVSFHVFDKNFENWCTQQIQDLYGTEVLKPNVRLTPITKGYSLVVPFDKIVYKKILFKNPHDLVKDLEISSSNENVLVIRTLRIQIQPGGFEFIKFKVKVSAVCEVFIVISHSATGMAEETLSIKISVDERPKTPERPPSGNLNKNKTWNFNTKRPSPLRNSGSY